MIYGAYQLTLYCDTPNCHNGELKSNLPVEFFAETGSECRKLARRAGWVLDGQSCMCPQCVRSKGLV